MAKKPCRETADLFVDLPVQRAPTGPTRPQRKHKHKHKPEFVDDTLGRRDISGTIRAGKRAVGGWFLRVDGRYEGYGAGQGGIFTDHHEARAAAYHWLRTKRDKNAARRHALYHK